MRTNTLSAGCRVTLKRAMSGAGLVLLLFATACSSLQSIDQLTASQSHKEVLLHSKLDQFNKAVYWGDLQKVALHLHEDSRSINLRKLKHRSQERLVELDISGLEFSDASSEAEVTLAIKYYGSPTYYVQTRHEKQLWKYHRLSGGWFLHEIEDLPKQEIISSFTPGAPSESPAGSAGAIEKTSARQAPLSR